MHLCNAYVLALAARDGAYARLFSTASLNLADGTPVAWTGRRLGYPGLSSVRGPSLMRAAMQDSARWNARHFLIGGSPETSDRLSARLPILVPGIDLVASSPRRFAR